MKTDFFCDDVCVQQLDPNHFGTNPLITNKRSLFIKITFKVRPCDTKQEELITALPGVKEHEHSQQDIGISTR